MNFTKAFFAKMLRDDFSKRNISKFEVGDTKKAEAFFLLLQAHDDVLSKYLEYSNDTH